ncbi:hypothetical protein SUSAZ_10310 [Sulfolobus acidocaldarius SUSAZ]|nr:hypothetical protein SUSAZ_10310 [Sulfolobus acidocaldarius SUSAZ]
MRRSPIQRNEYTKRNSNGISGVIELRLSVKSDYLHVGSGSSTYRLVKKIDNIDALVEDAIEGNIPDLSAYFSPKLHLMTKYSNGTFIIPGSTIKGLVRTRLELSIPGSCYIVSKDASNTSQTYRNIFKPRKKPRDRFDPVKFPKVCPVCDLLGNSGLASRVTFSDFVGEKVNSQNVKVRGDEYECVTKNSTFRGKVVFKGLKSVEIGMLLYGFGFRIGNNTITSKTMLLGRFKFSDRQFGRVQFSLVNSNPNYLNYLKEFVSKFKPLDFNEEW